jgi:XisH protein
MSSQFIGAKRDEQQLAIEIKGLQGRSVIAELEQAIGQYVLHRLLLTQVDPVRVMHLAISEQTYGEIFQEAIGQLVLNDLPLNLLVVDVEHSEVKQRIPPLSEKRSNK